MDQGADVVRSFAYAGDDEDQQRAYLRDLAEILVDLREKYQDPDVGGPDYRGRTWDYREAVAQIFRTVAGEVDPATIKRVKNNVRYHASTALRARIAGRPGELERLGLQAESVRVRARGRDKQRRLLNSPPDTSDDGRLSARVVHHARSLLGSVSAEDLADLPAEMRESVGEALGAIVEESVRLREGTHPVESTIQAIDGILEKYRDDVDPKQEEEATG